MQTLQEFHDHVVKTAHMFTAVRFKGRGKFERSEFNTLAQAIRFADLSYADKKTMIYAVNSDGRAVHVLNA